MTHNFRQVLAGILTGRHIVAILIFGAACSLLLIGPVLNDMFLGSVSAPLNKAAPVMFFAGLGSLTLGLIAGVALLDIAGAVMMGIVLAGALMVHY
jgi:hypothetical protein